MKIFKIFVPRSEYAKAKDKCIVILNILRKQDLEKSEFCIRREMARIVRARYAEAGGTKSLLEILTEYRKEL